MIIYTSEKRTSTNNFVCTYWLDFWIFQLSKCCPCCRYIQNIFRENSIRIFNEKVCKSLSFLMSLIFWIFDGIGIGETTNISNYITIFLHTSLASGVLTCVWRTVTGFQDFSSPSPPICLSCPWIPGFLVAVAARVPKLSLDSRTSRRRRRQGA